MDNDVRIAGLLQPEPDATTRLVLIPFPVDEGVRRNGGRTGASQAPPRILSAFGKMTPDARHAALHTQLLRRTAVAPAPAAPGTPLEEAQALLGAAVAAHLREGRLVVVLGGGHETLYGHFLGYAGEGQRVHLRNVDAHPDVRPLKDGRGHSGSPFRQALEHSSGCAADYAVAGLEPFCTAAAHAAYVQTHGAVHWRDELSNLNPADRPYFWATFFHAAGAVLASFDIDAVHAASAPGVSAINPAGLSPELWLEAAFYAGHNPAVRSMELVEYNPLFDIDHRTARLAALTLWHMTAGIAQRDPV